MSDIERNWKYADELASEDEFLDSARQHSLEQGVEPVSPAVAAQLSFVTAASGARSIVEIGTGLGVSGLALLRGAPRATLTSIDSEPDHHHWARKTFTDAGIATSRIRLIAGQALDVLPRMNDSSYDVVFIDADADHVIEYVEHGLRLVRVGGTVLVARALWKGRVADPAKRDATSRTYRTLLTEIAASTAVVSALSPAGDGLLQLSRRN